MVMPSLLSGRNPTTETQVDSDAVWAASVKTEDRDGEFATLRNRNNLALPNKISHNGP